jgi:hypothetical protein
MNISPEGRITNGSGNVEFKMMELPLCPKAAQRIILQRKQSQKYTLVE